jgi:hypothetical protein
MVKAGVLSMVEKDERNCSRESPRHNEEYSALQFIGVATAETNC